MLTRPLSHDERVMKAAFGRACDMVGGTTEMAAKLGMERQAGQITKWRSLDYADRLPSHLINVVDRAAGYPVMKEAICAVDGFEVRAVTPEDPDMPYLSAVACLGGEAGRALQLMVEAKADNVITLRELEGIENSARRAMQTLQRIIDAAHAEVVGLQESERPIRMTGGARG